MASYISFLRNKDVLEAYKELRKRGPLRMEDVRDDPAISSISRNHGVHVEIEPKPDQPVPGPVDIRDRSGILRDMVRPSESYLRACYGPGHECDLFAVLEAGLK